MQSGAYPDIFNSFNERTWKPGGFPRPLAARDRKWETDTGKANFKLPKALSASLAAGTDENELRLITLRSNDQFNTTIYGYRDRFRGIESTRMVVLMNRGDMQRLGLAADEEVTLATVADDGIARQLSGLRVVEYNIPAGCC